MPFEKMEGRDGEDQGTKKLEGNELPNDPMARKEVSDLPEDPMEGKESSNLPEEPLAGKADDLPEDQLAGQDVDDLPEDPMAGKEGSDLPEDPIAEKETTYKFDDNGNMYIKDGELCPNTTYVLNGNVYTTDEIRRIVDVQAKPTLTPDNIRDNGAQKDAGGADRKAGDQGGHIVGRDMGGDGGEGNLVPMDSKINQSDYKRMENEIKQALAEGKNVTTHTEISYSGGSKRPDIIKVTVMADGEKSVYRFDNNLNGTLKERVDKIGKKDAVEMVQSMLDETDGELSSIKEEFDKDGTLVRAKVNITYTDDTGKTKRTIVVIDNPKESE